MSNSIVPFAGGTLPSYLAKRTERSGINKDVATGAQFPTLSIKGKVFTLSSNNERKVLTKPDDPDEVMQHINLSILRANNKARTYYAEGYKEGESEGVRPACQSFDGIAPAANSVAPQSKKCAICPHAVWAKRVGDDGVEREGTDCAPNTRLAVADPDKLEAPILLRVPTASRKNLNDALKAADSRGIDYNMLVLRVGFVAEAASPKLSFKPIGLLSEEAYARATTMYDNEIVKEIVGADVAQATVTDAAPQLPAPDQPQEEEPAPPPPPPAPKAPAKAAAKSAEVHRSPVKSGETKPAAPKPEMSNLLSELDTLLGTKDD